MKQIKHMILLCLFCLTGMAAQAQTGPANTEIWYTATSEVTPTNILGTDDAALTVTSNNYDESTGIWKITFSGDVITIGENAFKGSKVLSSITIPASDTSIENSAFYQCYDSSKKTGLTTVTFAEDSKLGTIGEQAFYGCKVLSSITIPASVTSIGLQVFQNCSVLESISVDDGNTVSAALMVATLSSKRQRIR